MLTGGRQRVRGGLERGWRLGGSVTRTTACTADAGQAVTSSSIQQGSVVANSHARARVALRSRRSRRP
ncbi:MAG: DUF1737 domain-containing protein [Betaproteobacteria bacterium]|nr:DUF1737 domain-containing protein [Betaproteobacteria bacterium]